MGSVPVGASLYYPAARPGFYLCSAAELCPLKGPKVPAPQFRLKMNRVNCGAITEGQKARLNSDPEQVFSGPRFAWFYNGLIFVAGAVPGVR